MNVITYTLFDGLAYNTCGYFASCVVFFRSPQGRGKIRAMNKRFIIPLQKKLLFGNWFLFIGKSIQKHPDSVWENDVNNEQNVRAYYAKRH